MNQRRRYYDRCPYPGCVTTGNSPWLTNDHVPLPHVRCSCGWVGALSGLTRHAGQANRHQRLAGLPPVVHEYRSTLPLPPAVSA